MAVLALAYDSGFQIRCIGLNANNSTDDGESPVIPALRSFKAEEASLVQMLGASKSMATGVQNHAANTLTRLAATDPLAKVLLAAWNGSR
jgi:hypothetical protein